MPYGFCSNTGGFTTQQHGNVVLSTGRRKQLNLLIEDRHEENLMTYNWEDKPPCGFSMGRSTERMQMKAGQEVQHTIEADEELTVKVNNRRTPSGHFFQTINTALVDKQNPPNYYVGEDINSVAASTLRASRLGMSTGHSEPASPMAVPTAYSTSSLKSDKSPNHTQYTDMSTAKKDAPWLMPWQTGNKLTGRTVALQVRNKRTPSGNFSILTLAKASK